MATSTLGMYDRIRPNSQVSPRRRGISTSPTVHDLKSAFHDALITIVERILRLKAIQARLVQYRDAIYRVDEEDRWREPNRLFLKLKIDLYDILFRHN